MTVVENKLTPILIGFEVSGEILEQVLQVNKKMDCSKIDLSSRVPHVTLWMGFVKTKQIPSLKLGLEKIFQNISITAATGKLESYENEFGSVWSLNIEINRDLYLLQNRVHHFFEPFRELSGEIESLNETTLSYINGFATKSLVSFDPHITIGFGDMQNEINFPETIELSNPKMFELANYCTCKGEIQ